jgi:hypothetical protein
MAAPPAPIVIVVTPPAGPQEAEPTVAAPTGTGPAVQVRWRITASRDRIERALGPAGTWQPVDTPAPAPLRAGFAPSASVCWIVGDDGTVLRTTDGLRFESVRFPEAVHLTSISALDARQATVTTADGRTFRTTDGGLTWSRP